MDDELKECEEGRGGGGQTVQHIPRIIGEQGDGGTQKGQNRGSPSCGHSKCHKLAKLPKPFRLANLALLGFSQYSQMIDPSLLP